MPELPEVEIIKNQLIKTIHHQRVIDTYQSNKRLRQPIEDLSQLIGQKVFNISRKNKYIIINLTDFFLVIHLGMTGQLMFKDESYEHKHMHMKIYMIGGALVYQDPRRFGLIKIYDKKIYTIENIPLFENLGFEPLDESFTFEKFYSLIENNHLPLKKFLMDASYVCGIGNIYACEILFESCLHPERITRTINKSQSLILFDNIIRILQKSISLGGSSISDFVHVNGQSGKMQDNYFVYGRFGLNCKQCDHKIDKITQYGRTTFFCPNDFCQKK